VFYNILAEDGGSEVLRIFGILPHHNTQRHNPEDHDLSLHLREKPQISYNNLKFQRKIV
jgi:hypothetical protein